jgi:hypothetical protein
MAELRKLYAEENKTDAVIDYGNKFLFSMNTGDYSAPEYKMVDEFRQYTLPLQEEKNLFKELLASVRFEDVNKGRQGGCLGQARRSKRYSPCTNYHEVPHSSTVFPVCTSSFSPADPKLCLPFEGL